MMTKHFLEEGIVIAIERGKKTWLVETNRAQREKRKAMKERDVL